MKTARSLKPAAFRGGFRVLKTGRTWRWIPGLQKGNYMSVFLSILKVIAIVIAVLFVLTFVVYIFNLDMKLTAALEPLFMKHYDKIDKEKKQL